MRRYRRFLSLIAVVAVLISCGPIAGAADRSAEKAAPKGATKSKEAPKKKPARKRNGVFAPIEDRPGLPRVLLIGDSISIGYTLPTRKQLDGKANVHRIPTNGGPTIRGLEQIDAWLGDSKWDVIHFNWGLHDLRIDAPEQHQVPIDQYEKNLTRLVERLEKTGAQLVWASTTPVPEGSPKRTAGDEQKYNEVAAGVMKAHGVTINDLHAFILPRLAEAQLPANVHFKPAGSQALAAEVATAIESTLERSKGGAAKP